MKKRIKYILVLEQLYGLLETFQVFQWDELLIRELPNSSMWADCAEHVSFS